MKMNKKLNDRFSELINRLRLREVIRLAAKKKFSLLDLGCGEGELVRLAKEQGIKAVGYDKKYGQAVENLRVTKRFDVISLYHVLEHLADPIKVLKKIRFWLKPDGMLVIEVPLVGNLTERLLKQKYLTYLDKTHVNFWTKTDLLQLLTQSGWRAIKKKTCWYEYPLTVITQGGPLGFIFWFPFKILSMLGFNEEIIRIYLRRD